MKDATSMLTQDIDIGVTNLEITYCWGMSKMTVLDETNKYPNHNNILLVEFLEFLARIADCRFQGEIPLEEKIEMLLDALFPLVGF